jgi:para-aminobenzoate synthetase component 1
MQKKTFTFRKTPISYEIYKAAFDGVMNEILQGNSYLVNLTQPSFIDTDLSLEEIFYYSRARYRLWFNDQFVVFSPEIFVRIHNGMISSYPMKGTIDAAIPNAARIILNDEKEKAEHLTMVDLIRNDLSIFAKDVKVARLRYVDRLVTNSKDLLQVSSEITGRLPANYKDHIGHILFSLLPAGSVSGAPKPQTLEIIRSAEKYDRGFYTGVFGYFDGQNMDSGVMIRFIEKKAGELIYKSGGGITFQSDPKAEYQELINKIYVPFIRNIKS